MSEYLGWFGVDGLVAHVNIHPSAEWQASIRYAPATCDGFAAFLHDGFRTSDRTDEEAGFALTRGDAVIIPINIDFNPYGFLSDHQTLEAGNLAPALLAEKGRGMRRRS